MPGLSPLGQVHQAKQQPLSTEMESHELEGADWQHGYDEMVKLCRGMAKTIEALLKTKK